MRLLTILLFICTCNGCSSTKISNTSSNVLNGTWIPVKQEMGGKSLPKAFYENQQLIVAGNFYTLTAESTDKGEFKFANGKMDIYGKEGVNAGKHFTAIYKLDKAELTICYNLSGDAYPEAFETKSKSNLFLSVFVKK